MPNHPVIIFSTSKSPAGYFYTENSLMEITINSFILIFPKTARIHRDIHLRYIRQLKYFWDPCLGQGFMISDLSDRPQDYSLRIGLLHFFDLFCFELEDLECLREPEPDFSRKIYLLYR